MSWKGFPRLGTVMVVLISLVLAGTGSAEQTHRNRREAGPTPAVIEGESTTEGAIDDEPLEGDVFDLDLEQLAQADVVVNVAGDVLATEVTSVARSEVSIARTPSAVYVVTQEMIRRSGARNVMDVLRTVPGVHVARINANTWAISIRGFNGAYTDKLLVQIDGRAIYTPLFSGTFWEQQLVPLADIERIEVVRGPGATVWGANAVNGVINIVTKDSADTTGLYAEAGGGNEHRSFSYGRAGGMLGENATYRAYGTHVDDDAGLVLGAADGDFRRGGQGGFRVDWRLPDSDTFTLQGDFGKIGLSEGAGASDFTTGNFLTRWTRQVDADTDWSVQAYYDHFKGVYDPASAVVGQVGQNVFDVDAQRHARRDHHEFVYGFGFRNYETYLRTEPGQALDFIPDTDSFDIISYFLQDTITVREDLLFLTLGCKFEHNDFVDFVYQPAVKVALTPRENVSLWGSVSRAVRTPSVMNRDILLMSPLGGGDILRLTGTRDLQAEQALTYEIGVRHQPTDRFYWEVAAYFCRYDDLIRSVPVGIDPPFVDATFFNSGAADTYGFEYWASYEVAPWQRLRGSYSFYREMFDDGGLPTLDLVNMPGSYPRNMSSLVSSTDLTRQVTLDTIVRYVDALAAVDSYIELDMRLAWSLCNGMELSVVGQNLLDSSHIEFVDPTGVAGTTGVQRGVYGMVSWQY